MLVQCQINLTLSNQFPSLTFTSFKDLMDITQANALPNCIKSVRLVNVSIIYYYYDGNNSTPMFPSEMIHYLSNISISSHLCATMNLY